MLNNQKIRRVLFFATIAAIPFFLFMFFGNTSEAVYTPPSGIPAGSGSLGGLTQTVPIFDFSAIERPVPVSVSGPAMPVQSPSYGYGDSSDISPGNNFFIENQAKIVPSATVRDIPWNPDFIDYTTTFSSDDFSFATEDTGSLWKDPDTGTTFAPASVGGVTDKILGEIGGAINGALKDVGLPGIDFGALSGVVGGVGGLRDTIVGGGFAGPLGGVVSGVLGGGNASGALGGIFSSGGLGGGVGGPVSGLSGGGAGSYVPVKDFTQISLQQQQVIKEYNLDSVAYLSSKTTIRGILGNVLSWINTGDNGNPYYVTNSVDHFNTVDNGVIDTFLAELLGLGINQNLQQSLALGASPQFRNVIQPTISPTQRNAFMQDFNNGGWEMWLTMLQSQNNPLGQYRLANEELTRRRYEAELRQSQELAWGNGFKSATVCVAQDFAGNCVRTEVATPGTFIGGQMGGVFSSVIRQLEADDELGEITNTLLSSMISQILGGRATGLRGFSSAALSSPLTDVPAVNRGKEGLQEAIGIHLENEVAYYIAKSSSVIRLQEGKDSLLSLITARTYYSANEPIKTRLTSNAELTSEIENNRSYATTTVQTIIDPAIAITPPDIARSVALIESVQTLMRDLSSANTPQGLSLISERFVDLSRRTHSLTDVENAKQEFETINGFVNGLVQDVNARMAREQSIVEKITNEAMGIFTN